MSLLYLKDLIFVMVEEWEEMGRSGGVGGVEVCGCGANTFLRAIIQNFYCVENVLKS